MSSILIYNLIQIWLGYMSVLECMICKKVNMFESIEH
jgi:hypothetical protein